MTNTAYVNENGPNNSTFIFVSITTYNNLVCVFENFNLVNNTCAQTINNIINLHQITSIVPT